MSGAPLAGRIFIRGDDESVEIELADDSSGVRVIIIEMTARDFLSALLHRREAKCSYTSNHAYADRWGATVEMKTEEVPFDLYGPRSTRKARAKKALASFEIDGWAARLSDMENGHCVVGRDKAINAKQRVIFTRFVRDGIPTGQAEIRKHAKQLKQKEKKP